MSAQLVKQQRISLAQTSLGKPTPAYYSEGVYVDPETVAGLQVYNQGTVRIYEFKVAARHSWVSSWVYADVTSAFLPSVTLVGASESIRALSQKLCETHPAISTYEGIFGGMPHLNGLRISVADILEQLYLSGSIAAVQRIYSPDVSEDQIKEAIAYAQDFLESAISSSP
jgi:uncharacterized protein (DUF433 family)